jgi:hypothetical protein
LHGWEIAPATASSQILFGRLLRNNSPFGSWRWRNLESRLKPLQAEAVIAARRNLPSEAKFLMSANF